VRFLRLVHRGTRIPFQAILDNAEDCTLEEIVGPDIYPSVPVHVMRRVLCFARLAEAASLLQQAETIKHPLWEDESERGELAPDVLNLLGYLFGHDRKAILGRYRIRQAIEAVLLNHAFVPIPLALDAILRGIARLGIEPDNRVLAFGGIVDRPIG
jgi:hypothetical protein